MTAVDFGSCVLADWRSSTLQTTQDGHEHDTQSSSHAIQCEDCVDYGWSTLAHSTARGSFGPTSLRHDRAMQAGPSLAALSQGSSFKQSRYVSIAIGSVKHYHRGALARDTPGGMSAMNAFLLSISGLAALPKSGTSHKHGYFSLRCLRFALFTAKHATLARIEVCVSTEAFESFRKGTFPLTVHLSVLLSI